MRYTVKYSYGCFAFAKFRYWTDALAYAKARAAGVNKDDDIVIVRKTQVVWHHYGSAEESCESN